GVCAARRSSECQYRRARPIANHTRRRRFARPVANRTRRRLQGGPAGKRSSAQEDYRIGKIKANVIIHARKHGDKSVISCSVEIRRTWPELATEKPRTGIAWFIDMNFPSGRDCTTCPLVVHRAAEIQRYSTRDVRKAGYYS